MENNFKVAVNEEYEFEFSEEEVQALDTVDLSSSTFHLLNENKSFSAELLHSDFYKRTYEVQIKSNRYSVKISNELDQLINEMGLTAVSAKDINEVNAPMPGMILEIMAAVGQEVKEGDYLLVLEAMKMENTLTAPRDGVVKALHIEKGETVDKNQLLVELE